MKLLTFIDLILYKIISKINLHFNSKSKIIDFKNNDKNIFPSIDVVIPLVKKDLNTVKYAVKSLKSHSLNPIRNIYIVAPLDPEIIKYCEDSFLIHINEDIICPLNNSQIEKIIENSSRIGWIKQQLIKLNSNNITGISEYFLLLDSDTVITKEQFFLSKDYTVLKFSDEYHFMYQLSKNYMLKFCQLNRRSFITHHQLIKKEYLSELQSHIDLSHNDFWPNIFLKAAVKFNLFVSEYELYGNFVTKFYSKNIRKQYWFNKNVFYRDFECKENFILDETNHSISFHNYQ